MVVFQFRLVLQRASLALWRWCTSMRFHCLTYISINITQVLSVLW